MKVLIVVHGFPPAAQGGTELYAQSLARVLRREFGDEVLVLTRDQDPNRPEYGVRAEDRDGLRIVWINNTFSRTRSFDQTYRNTELGALADRVIDDFRPDVAHIHHLTCLSTGIVRSLAVRRIPSIFTLHDYWLLCHRGQLLNVDFQLCDGPEPSGCRHCLGAAAGAATVTFSGAAAIRALERRLPEAPARQLRRAAHGVAAAMFDESQADDQARQRFEHMREVASGVTRFLAPSQYMHDRFVQFGVPTERITVARLGLDHSRFGHIERTKSDRLRLGFLGTLMVSKAPHLLLEAIGQLARGSVSVDLFGAHAAYHGDDSYRRQLEPLLTGEGVHVRGAIAHELVPQALASIDVLVVPSIWPENSPLVIQEAFLAGVPVVASRIGGIPEMVDDGRSGLLFTPNDAADLARKLRRLQAEPLLLDTLRAGIPRVRTIEDDVRATRGFYEALRPVAGPAVSISAPAPRLAAVVLNYRAPDETLLAVKSLLASRRPIDDIVVVDNDRDGTEETRDTLKDVWPHIRYVSTGANLGFSGGMNAGIREALARGADRVMLVNSDVIVPPDCTERLEQSLDRMPRAGIVGPVILSRSAPDRIASLGMSYAPATGRMRHTASGELFADQGHAADVIVDGVTGCLMLVKREVFEGIGLLDEDYFFSFEDLDFCLKARNAGWPTLLTGAAMAYHEGGRSIGATSPSRLYFAARNHLLMAHRTDPGRGRLARSGRTVSIVMLNLAHAVISKGGSLPARLEAVLRGTRDYMAGRFGTGSEDRFTR